MGVEFPEFRVATNQNDVLHQLFNSGEYALSEVRPSLAPSMDIQIASNFERLLYFILNKDTLKVREVMSAFRENERYCFENFEVSGFSSCSSEDSEIPELIQKISKDYDYLVDPPHVVSSSSKNDPAWFSLLHIQQNFLRSMSALECKFREQMYWKLYFQLSLPSINLSCSFENSVLY